MSTKFDFLTGWLYKKIKVTGGKEMEDVIVREHGGGIPQVEAGTYQAVCSGIWDIGGQKKEWQGKTKIVEQVIIRFELFKKIETEGEYQGKRYCLNKWYTKSLGEKANLRKDLESWRGKKFTIDELKGFGLRKLIGVNCMLGVGENEKGKAVIATISKLIDGIQKIEPENNINEVPEWVQKFIGGQESVDKTDDQKFNEAVENINDDKAPF